MVDSTGGTNNRERGDSKSCVDLEPGKRLLIGSSFSFGSFVDLMAQLVDIL